jgi:hypothetical protein
MYKPITFRANTKDANDKSVKLTTPLLVHKNTWIVDLKPYIVFVKSQMNIKNVEF